MSNLLIKQAKVIFPNSSYHEKTVDIWVKDGHLEAIDEHLTPATPDTKVLEAANLHVSMGWFDMRANFREPGDEHLENLASGMDAAANGGFTGVCLNPGTTPAIDNKAHVNYIIEQAKNELVTLIPNGGLSKNLEGLELAEMYDMHLAGARGFYNGKNTEFSAALMQKALLYARQINETVINFPLDKSICGEAQVHEGVVGTSLGLKGIPAIAEEVRLNRDLYLTEYTEGKYHAASLSCEGSIALMRQAKAKGLNVSCDVNAYHLMFTDDVLSNFDTFHKVMPPYRGETDRQALIQGLKDGTINVICSNHEPWDQDHKKLEFDFASYGVSSIETLFPVCIMSLKTHLNLTEIIEKITVQPRRILGINTPELRLGEEANFTLFDPALTYILSADQLKSKGKNTPLIGKELTGKALGLIRGKHHRWMV